MHTRGKRAGDALSLTPFSIISFAVSRGDSTGISVNEAVDPSTRRIEGADQRSRLGREEEGRSKCESLNDRRIEKTLYDRVNKRPSAPSEEAKGKKRNVGVGGGGALHRPEKHFLFWLEV